MIKTRSPSLSDVHKILRQSKITNLINSLRMNNYKHDCISNPTFTFYSKVLRWGSIVYNRHNK